MGSRAVKKLGRTNALVRAGVLGATFLGIAVWAAMAEPSPLTLPALLGGLVLGAFVMTLFIRRGWAVPGYAGSRNTREVGMGATIGIAVAFIIVSAASVVSPSAPALLGVALAATAAGFFLILLPALVRRP